MIKSGCFAITFLISLGCSSSYCDYLRELRTQQIKGEIQSIDIYKFNKGEMFLHLVNFDGEKVSIDLGIENDASIRDYAQAGDSLFKGSNTLLVRITKSTGEEESFDLTRSGCPKN